MWTPSIVVDLMYCAVFRALEQSFEAASLNLARKYNRSFLFMITTKWKGSSAEGRNRSAQSVRDNKLQDFSKAVLL